MIPPLCHNIVITIATSGGSCNIYFMFLGKYVVSRLGATEGWWFSQETEPSDRTHPHAPSSTPSVVRRSSPS